MAVRNRSNLPVLPLASSVSWLTMGAPRWPMMAGGGGRRFRSIRQGEEMWRGQQVQGEQHSQVQQDQHSLRAWRGTAHYFILHYYIIPAQPASLERDATLPYITLYYIITLHYYITLYHHGLQAWRGMPHYIILHHYITLYYIITLHYITLLHYIKFNHHLASNQNRVFTKTVV